MCQMLFYVQIHKCIYAKYKDNNKEIIKLNYYFRSKIHNFKILATDFQDQIFLSSQIL